MDWFLCYTLDLILPSLEASARVELRPMAGYTWTSVL